MLRQLLEDLIYLDSIGPTNQPESEQTRDQTDPDPQACNEASPSFQSSRGLKSGWKEMILTQRL